MDKKKAAKPNYTFYLKVFWALFSFSVLSVFAIFLLVSMGAFGKLPTFKELESPEKNFASEIISSDGVTLGKYFRENRTPVSYDELPQELVDALVATEDERFYEHSGIDFFSLARAIAKLGQDGGGSTITQQLAKQLFTENYGTRNIVKRIAQKLKEWVIAVKLEKQYTKDEIITMYLNKYDFLYNAIGIRSASRIYFNKEPIDLNIEESAILVGMAKNPSLYNPKRFPENALRRRATVFGQLERNGFITETEKDSLNALPIEIDYNPEGHSDGHATYFREYLRDYLKTWIKNHPKPDGTHYDLYSDGLKIYVTLDSRMQKYAEQAVDEHMSNLQRIFFKEQKRNKTAPFYDLDKSEIDRTMWNAVRTTDRYRTLNTKGLSKKEILQNFKKKRKMNVFDWKKGSKDTLLSPYDSIKYYKTFLHSGLLALEPQTGHIKAWVGGINHKYFKYDHVKQGKRQVGSTFKPFVYASAINQFRISPCEKYPNTPFTIPQGKYGLLEDWTPKNAGDEYGGELTLKQALAKSINVITARMIDRVGPSTVVQLAKKSGITSDIPAYPSIALGTVDASLYDMVGAYAMFANKGFRVHQTMVMRIEDKNGSVLQRFVPESEEVMSEEAAYAVLDLLKGVTMEGSGVRLRGKWGKYPENVATGYPYEFTNPIAGKTGTTQNQSDGWFMGVVPNLAVGVWTGADERATHFKGITFGQGASMSLPTWALFMKKCYADETLTISQEDFEQPENFGIAIDCGSDDDKVDETSLIETNPDF
ncbi:penicillin-binding protein 1A [Wenyingzhuangia marina]|uniref:Penicillin-binding protein 1A n=1 Tax=Wenyingzhuangia marina TaxID=1195760 RepID=A0A1M5SZS2_9FLAO|nr:transglycosylase domain-containing protein [Wenyingzhuangia marina]GGF64827.1 penicillin-binding protein 1A [Wenyingzhuangia marina]SHH43989.1 penicillin-binding protein 1A [Wenyingzhuangia marina]